MKHIMRSTQTSMQMTDHLVNLMMTTPQESLHQLLRATPASTLEYLEDEEEEEDFQTVPLNDDHWTTGEIPDRTLCIHEHGLPHGLCPYPCPVCKLPNSFICR